MSSLARLLRRVRIGRRAKKVQEKGSPPPIEDQAVDAQADTIVSCDGPLNLLSLPLDLLELIASFVSPRAPLNAAAQTSRQLYAIFNLRLYRFDAELLMCRSLRWAAEKGNAGTAQKAIMYCASCPSIQYALPEALKTATLRGDHEVLRKLLPATDLASELIVSDAKEKGKYNLIEIAAMRGDAAVIRILIGHGGIALDRCCESASGATALSLAARRGHEEAVRALLEAGADSQSRDHGGWPVLWYAVEGRNAAVVELLLRAGNLDPNQMVAHKGVQSLLCKAASSGRIRICKLLLKAGADPQPADSLGGSPMFWAVKRQDVSLVKLLLAWGATPHFLTSQKYTPMAFAAKQGSAEIIQLFLDAGFGPYDDSYSTFADTPLGEAIKSSDTRVIKLLLTHASFKDVPQSWKLEVLETAIIEDDTEVLNMLPMHLPTGNNLPGDELASLWTAVDYGLDKVLKNLISPATNRRMLDKYGQTPFLLAVKKRHSRVARFLMDEGFDIETGDSDGCPPVYYACLQCPTVARLLLEKHPTFSGHDELGGTLLMAAVQGGHVGIVRLLLERGARCNHKEAFRNGIIAKSQRIAASDDQAAEAQKLIRAPKVDFDMKNTWSKQTPLFAAIDNGHFIIVEALLDTGQIDMEATDDGGDTPLLRATRLQHFLIMEDLIKHGVSPNARDASGCTSLQLAVLHGSQEQCLALLKAKDIDVDARCGEAQTTTLMEAVRLRNSDLVKLLLEHKADPNVQSSSGSTALSDAAERGFADMAELLLKTNNANPHIENKRGETPLLLATRAGYDGIVQMLLKAGADAEAAWRLDETAAAT